MKRLLRSILTFQKVYKLLGDIWLGLGPGQLGPGHLISVFSPSPDLCTKLRKFCHRSNLNMWATNLLLRALDRFHVLGTKESMRLLHFMRCWSNHLSISTTHYPPSAFMLHKDYGSRSESFTRWVSIYNYMAKCQLLLMGTHVSACAPLDRLFANICKESAM